MKIVKQLCLQHKISFNDMASLLDIPLVYAVLACGERMGFDRERLAIATFFGYTTWVEMEQRNSERVGTGRLLRINKSTQILVGARPERTIIEQAGTATFYEYDGCWYVEDVFFLAFSRQQFFKEKEAQKDFFSKKLFLIAQGAYYE